MRRHVDVISSSMFTQGMNQIMRYIFFVTRPYRCNRLLLHGYLDEDSKSKLLIDVALYKVIVQSNCARLIFSAL